MANAHFEQGGGRFININMIRSIQFVEKGAHVWFDVTDSVFVSREEGAQIVKACGGTFYGENAVGGDDAPF